MNRSARPASIAACLLFASAAHAQLDGNRFYLLNSDGLIYTGGFWGQNRSHYAGDTGLGLSPGTGNGSAHSLSFDPSGRLFALGDDRPTSGQRLAEIDRQDYTSRTIHSYGTLFVFAGTVTDDGYKAYHDSSSSSFIQISTIDLQTGELTSSVDDTEYTGIISAWTPRSDGMLFAATNRGDFYSVDPLTGTKDALGSFGDGISDFATYQGNTYFGHEGSSGGYDVYSIDPFTGQYALETTIFGDHSSGPGDIFGFAITVPTPGAAIALVGVGVFNARRRR